MTIARNALLRMSKSHWLADRVMTRADLMTLAKGTK